MTTSKQQTRPAPTLDQQLAEMLERATAAPGVKDLLAVYDQAERAYAATIREPRVWYSTSTNPS
jgi:hypothetical protein